ncbi:aminodeoxychorismate/anthranilate synthase component II [Campylobacter sp. US33a]|uniref:Aminodeoxychorismate/anthranilate synthase component II n=1 Tax=Campylobacter sp. CCS1377 TaxID=3158229 RepID=A0AAU7E572_9BACT|nr:aminodeoxychorismate/anthranilate synthase component II [Campylobacter sp. US33a]MCW1360965.1 aminodeoxychorismate/anthranilate synthase component II [Campylobacter jejuni]TEY01592.1 aminodeoxychorismate/anthranilate synthase component II [Campylobacter sp. US33a]
MKKILFIDNYDSFSYTIIFYLKELGFKCKVIKNDEFKKAKDLAKFNFSHLIISPGPNSPSESKLSLKAIKYFKKDKKILGICLGHQCIGEVFGGKISKMPYPMHGKISRLHLNKNAKKTSLFKGIKDKSKICLYHSLHISKMPKNCEILALNDENIIMAIKHKKYEIYGVQFHPEAILSQNGKKLLKNFMEN